MEPEIYVLDEPSSNLDIGTIEMLKAIINKWKEKKATIIIAEHRLRYLIDIADKFILYERWTDTHYYSRMKNLKDYL